MAQQETTVAESVTSHTFGSLKDGEEYEVRMRTETEHVVGDWTTPTNDITILPAPSGFSATGVSETDITVNWTDNADNEDGYRVFRRRVFDDGSTGPETQVGDHGPGQTSHTDTDLSPGNTYRYRVQVYTDHTTSDATFDASTTAVDEPRSKGFSGSGWYVEIDHPDGPVVRPTILETPQRNPRVNGLPRVRIPVPKNDRWHESKFKGATMRVYFDGIEQPIDEVADVEQNPGENVLIGRGGIELLNEVSTDVVSEEAWVVGRDLVQDETTYTANFDDPGGTPVEETILDLDSDADWQSVTTIGAADPFFVDAGRFKIRQTLHFSEGRDFDRQSGESASTANAYSDGFAARIGDGDWVEYDFTPLHDIPQDDVAVGVRKDNEDGASLSDYDITVKLDNVVLDSHGGDLSFSWEEDYTTAPFGSGDWDTNGFDLQAGTTYTIRIENNGAAWYDVDCVCLYDDGGRFGGFEYHFDNSVDANDYLSGPWLYPDGAAFALDTQAITGNAVAARIASSWNNVANAQKMEVSNDGGITYPLSVSNSSTLDQSFADPGVQLKAQLTLGGTDETRTTATPTTGFNGQTVDSFQLFADVTDTAVMVNYSAGDRLVDVLREIADYSDSVFEFRRSGGTDSVEWTTPGTRTADVNPQALDYSVTESTVEVVEKATVYGAGKQLSGEEFTSDHGTEVDLENSPIVESSEVVHDGAGTTFTRDEDYVIRYNAGTIETLSNGTMSDSTTYEIDYRYKVSATVTADGVSDPQFRRFDFPSVSTVRGCRQVASVLVEDLKDPVVRAELIVEKQPLGWNVIEAINPDIFPTSVDLQMRDIDQTPRQARVMFESRKSAEQEAAELRQRIGTVSRRS